MWRSSDSVIDEDLVLSWPKYPEDGTEAPMVKIWLDIPGTVYSQFIVIYANAWIAWSEQPYHVLEHFAELRLFITRMD